MAGIPKTLLFNLKDGVFLFCKRGVFEKVIG
jgi:hypothetical protein